MGSLRKCAESVDYSLSKNRNLVGNVVKLGCIFISKNPLTSSEDSIQNLKTISVYLTIFSLMPDNTSIGLHLKFDIAKINYQHSVAEKLVNIRNDGIASVA